MKWITYVNSRNTSNLINSPTGPPAPITVHHKRVRRRSKIHLVSVWMSEWVKVSKSSPGSSVSRQNLFVLTDSGPWTLTNRNFSKNWWEARRGTRARLYWDSFRSTTEWQQVTGTLLALREGSLAPLMGESGGGSEDWEGGMGWLRRSADPFGGVVYRAHAQYPAFAPGASEVVVGFWPFCILLFIIIYK